MTTPRAYRVALFAVVLLAPSFAFAQAEQAEAAPMAQQPPPPPPPGYVPVAPPPAGVPIKVEEDHPAPNSVFAEGLGSGLFYSINYERRVIDDLGVRAGFGYMSIGSSASSGGVTVSSKQSWLTFPITASYMGLRSGKHALEVGGGGTLLYYSGQAGSSSFGSTGSASGSNFTAVGNILFGYRLHPVDGAGFQFRVGVMALLGAGFSLAKDAQPGDFGVLPWGYISFGAGF